MKAWPALSEMYGLHPWDIGRLSVPEIEAYLDHLKRTHDEMRKQRGR